MKLNRKLLPIKAHYFLFMAAMGPILPFIVVVAKQFGISEVMFGTINAFLPLLYFLAKPLYGYLIDFFSRIQMLIYTLSITIMGLCFLAMYVPSYINRCTPSCKPQVYMNVTGKLYLLTNDSDHLQPCNVLMNDNCSVHVNTSAECDNDASDCTKYSTWDSIYEMEFLVFIAFMCLGLVLFNICNSITDAICFNILGKGNEMNYGQQRVWGSVGYGLTAVMAGYLVDRYSGNSAYKDHTAGFILFACFMLADIFVCMKLNPTRLDKPVNILKSTMLVLHSWKVALFMGITFVFGVCDGFAIYYLFWYLEDLAAGTDISHIIRSIEGMTTFIQTFFGEVIFFHYSGKIVEKIGYDAGFILCFFAYFLRFVLMSVISNVWWVLPIEAIMQGFSYALSYTLIVSFTNRISRPGIEATMQGLVTAVYDSIGYALGSFMGGILYKKYGGRGVFFIFSMLALFCCFCYVLAILVSRLFGRSFGIIEESNNMPEEVVDKNGGDSDVNERLTLDIL